MYFSDLQIFVNISINIKSKVSYKVYYTFVKYNRFNNPFYLIIFYVLGCRKKTYCVEFSK